MATGLKSQLTVAVVADNPETLDGLHAYLSGAGVSSRAMRALGDVGAVPRELTAVVIFPDELDAAEVVAHVRRLRASRPRVLVLLVTGMPQRFSAALDPDGRSIPPIVLPKPAFGWSILDAIRAHAQAVAP